MVERFLSMSNSIRRYKQTVQYLRRVIIEGGGYNLTGFRRSRLSVTFTKDLYSLMNVGVSLEGDFTKNTIIYEEGSDGNIYIGYDLNNVRIVTADMKSIKQKLNSGFYVDTPQSRRDIKDLLDKGVEVEDTEGYKDIVKKLDEFYSTTKLDIFLEDSQFPKLRNRKLLPLFIIKCADGVIDYCIDNYATTYRKYRRTLKILNLPNKDYKSINFMYSNHWLDCKASGKYLDKCYIF